jgi:hypothetical protein
VLRELEVRGGEPELGRTRTRSLEHLGLLEDIGTGGAVAGPVADGHRVPVGVSDVRGHSFDDRALAFRELGDEGRLVSALVIRWARREGDLGRTDDGAVLVDPDRERHVGHTEVRDELV